MNRINEIVEELRDSNYKNFDEFYELTKRQVYFAIMAIVKSEMVTQDLMQDTYLRFLNYIDSYKKNTNPVSFLVTMCRNLAYNEYNKRKKEVLSEHIDEMNSDSENNKSNDSEVFQMLKILDDEEKQIVTLHIISSLKFREITQIMNKPLGTILWIYNKAIKKLKKEAGVECEK